jgi:regulatory protein
MNKSLTPDMAYPKMRQYCGYSERCHYEVRERLFTMGLSKKDVEQILTKLIEEDYLNEERYAIHFAGGHFRQKKWGRVKIEYALRQKRVSEPNIKRAMKEIMGEDYQAALQKLTETKWKSLQAEQNINREVKTTAFLLQKGYERGMIQQVIAKIKAQNRE